MFCQANIIAEGSYHKLQASNLNFTKLLGSSVETTVNECKDESNTNNLHTNKIYRQQSSNHSTASSIEETKFSEIQAEPVDVAETRSSGSVSHSVYTTYFSAGGSSFKIFFFFFICIFTQIIASGGDFWITYWYYAQCLLNLIITVY